MLLEWLGFKSENAEEEVAMISSVVRIPRGVLGFLASARKGTEGTTQESYPHHYVRHVRRSKNPVSNMDNKLV